MKSNAIYTGILCLLFVVLINPSSFGQTCPLNVTIASDINVLFNDCAYESDSSRFSIYISSVTGGSGVYNISHIGEGMVSDSKITSGGSFVYAWSAADQQFAIPQVGFTIDDGAGTVCTLFDIDPFVQAQIEIVGFDVFCNNPLDSCANALTYDSNYPSQDSVYTARFALISKNLLHSNGTVVYEGGNFVRLESGFEVPASTDFLADINTCYDDADPFD